MHSTIAPSFTSLPSPNPLLLTMNPTMFRFCNFSTSQVTRALSSSSILLRSNSRPITTGTFRVTFPRSLISPRSYSTCLDSQEKTCLSPIDAALDSVVKIFSVSSPPDVVQPWQKNEEESATGSGFVISKDKILTNAHVVENHSYVEVRKHGSSTKYKAKVEVVGHECDLAILAVDSKKFWEDMVPLELGDVPFVNEAVSVLGYPQGGDTISVTKGIVSRVESRKYAHSSVKLLTIQVDAAINSGNSGGPVVMGNKVAGVAFQGLFWSNNIGYIIPTPIIKHFLSCYEESGEFNGFGSLDISYQSMADDQMRQLFKMNDKLTGILVNEINPLSDAYKFLKKDDVILAIDGVPIGNDAEVPFRKKETVCYNHLVSMKKPDEAALFKILRDGTEHEFNISLNPVQKLVPVRQLDPSYYIFAGFVFVPLSETYMDETYGICECAFKKKMPKKAGEEIVIISQVFLNDITRAYSDFKNLQVKKVNGVEVLNLKHLRDLIENCDTKYLRLDLEDERVVALDFKSAKKATSSILERQAIRSAMSKDLQVKKKKN